MGRRASRHRKTSASARASPTPAIGTASNEATSAEHTDSARALFADILAHPEDDGPRLVYADFLEEHGDPRGELIQLQCQLARISDADPRWRVLTDRAAELDKRHAKQWLADVWALGLPRTRLGFRRGFVETIACPIAIATDSIADHLIARAPLLAVAKLSVDGQLDRLALAAPPSTKLLARLSELSIEGRRAGNTHGGQGPMGRFAALATTPFERLRSLHLGKLRVVDDSELCRLVSSRHLADLEELRLNVSLASRALVDVFAHPACRALRRLDLSANDIDVDGISSLARSKILDHVVDLDLSQTNMTMEALDELLRDSRLRSVERMALRWNPQLREGVARSLAAWPGGTKLRELDLRGSALPASRDVILASPKRAALRSLTVE